MPWHLTHDITAFVTAADDYLRGDPVRNTVALSVLAGLLESGLRAYGDAPPLFGWHESAAGQADGAVLRTPPHPMLVAGFPAGSAADLLRQLADTQQAGAQQAGGQLADPRLADPQLADPQRAVTLPDAANMTEEHTEEFSAAWASVTGGRAAIHHRMRMFRLAALQPPRPAPAGAGRAPAEDDFGLLVRWTDAFGAETAVGSGDAAREVREHLSYGGITLWDDQGPAAMAVLSRSVAGVCRVGTVYTPPERRQRGYGGAVTAAVSQRALDAGAAEVVLYTDLANPTSNALYRRLGYRPVGDRIALDLR